MFSKILLAFLIVGGTFGYIYYKGTESKIATLQTKNLELQNVIRAQEFREEEQAKTIDSLQKNMAKTAEALQAQTKRNQEIEAEAQRYLAIFARHDLSKLAAAKPGLIETRINKGTANVFKTIEDDTAVIDNLDN